jgi:thioredoxin-dependent peroxiredoxin
MASINFQGKSVNTCGELPAIGSHAPDFSLTDGKLGQVSLSTYAGKKKCLNIVPSLDTPTCAASARKFNQKAASLENGVVLVISADLPFAQSRFCQVEGIRDVVPLSTFRSSFARDYGVELVDSVLSGLTARAIIVIDEKDRIVYCELVDELTDEPDYESALAAMREMD